MAATTPKLGARSMLCCNEGHRLVWCRGVHEVLACNSCAGPVLQSDLCLSCEYCDYDLCSACGSGSGRGQTRQIGGQTPADSHGLQRPVLASLRPLISEQRASARRASAQFEKTRCPESTQPILVRDLQSSHSEHAQVIEAHPCPAADTVERTQVAMSCQGETGGHAAAATAQVVVDARPVPACPTSDAVDHVHIATSCQSKIGATSTAGDASSPSPSIRSTKPLMESVARMMQHCGLRIPRPSSTLDSSAPSVDRVKRIVVVNHERWQASM